MHRVATVLYSENREMLASGAELTTILNIIDTYLQHEIVHTYVFEGTDSENDIGFWPTPLDTLLGPQSACVYKSRFGKKQKVN